jgi:hypothetical protein
MDEANPHPAWGRDLPGAVRKAAGSAAGGAVPSTTSTSLPPAAKV